MAVAQVHLPHLAHDRREAAAATPRPVPALARMIVVWVIAATVAFLVGLTAVLWAVTGNFVAALGVGGFCALWGGPGFGIMAASAAHAMQTERAERLALQHAAG